VTPRSVTLRGPCADDTAFVVDSWAKSARGRLSRDERRSITHEMACAAILRILRAPGITLRIAEDAGSRIVGFAAGVPSEGVVHYAYVKSDHRRSGIARILVGAMLGPNPSQAPRMLCDGPDRLVARMRREGWTVSRHAFVIEACRGERA
jgi:hypothetical protein